MSFHLWKVPTWLMELPARATNMIGNVLIKWLGLCEIGLAISCFLSKEGLVCAAVTCARLSPFNKEVTVIKIKMK